MELALSNLVERINRLAAAPGAGSEWRDAVIDAVQHLRTGWIRHRTGSDDDGGLYRDLTETEPRVSPLVNRLRDESRGVIECCDVALTSLARGDTPDAEVRHVLREITRRASRYLNHVTSVTYETVAVDLGCG
jgi:hypothetical protein